jgi:hypothetical protein
MKALGKLLSLIFILLVGSSYAQNLPVRIITSDITSNTTFRPDTVYLINASISISSGVDLIILPKTIVKFAYQSSNSSKTCLSVNGRLIAQGTSDSLICFTSSRDDSYGGDSNHDSTTTQPAPGDWGFIQINNGSCVIEHCVFRYGGYKYNNEGGNYYYRNYQLWVNGVNPTVRNCRFQYYYEYGLYWTYAGYNRVELSGLNLGAATGSSWAIYYSGSGAPWIHGNVLSIANSGIYCNYSGSDSAVVDSNAITGVSGGSTGIQFAGASSNKVLVFGNTVLGTNGTGNGIYILNSSSSGRVNANTVRHFLYGITCENSSIGISDNVITSSAGGARYPFYQAGNSFPTYSNNADTGLCRAVAVSGTIAGVGTWSPVVNGDSVAYVVVSDITVGSGGNLTLPANTVVKFQYQSTTQYKRCLIVSSLGLLTLGGTDSQPVYFTSDRDDSLRYDSNGDGWGTGSPGDWGFIQINNGSCVIEHCVFRYGGYKYNNEGGNYYYRNYQLWVNGVPALIRYNKFNYCYASGTNLKYDYTGVSTVAILSNQYYGTGSGIVFIGSQGNSNPQINNNTLVGTGPYIGIQIDGALIGSEIHYNNIAGYGVGIDIYRSSPQLRQNDLSGNTTAGIRINRVDTYQPFPDIAFNTIVGNTSYGVQYYTSSSSLPHPAATLSHNSIFNNAGFNVYFNACSNPTTDTVSLLNNWWGTNDSTQIAAKIYDHYDNTSSPYSKFWPCLLGPEDSLCASDFNLSGRVDGGDLIPLAIAFGSDTLDTDWNPVCDLDASFRIDGFDLAIFGTEFGSIGGCPDRLLKIEPMPLESLFVTLIYPSHQIVGMEEYEVELALESPIPTNGLVFELDLTFLEVTDAEFVPAQYYGDEATQYCLQAFKDGDLFGGLSRLSCSRVGITGNGVLGSLRLRTSKNTLLEEIPIRELSLVDPYGTSFYSPVIRHMFKSDSNLPTTFELSQNYPNPFNASTIIRFALPQSGEVSLSVYNILGQRVRMLANSTMDAGYHQVTWDGTNETGERVSSGVYYYLLDTPQYHYTKKMIVVK